MVIAGRGRLPELVAEGAVQSGREVAVVVIQGQGDPSAFAHLPHKVFRLGAGAKAVAYAREKGGREVVMAGGIQRPSLTSVIPDGVSARVLTRVGFKALGDDGILKIVRQEMEKLGFVIRSPADFVDQLLMPEGNLGRARPDEQALRDIRHGLTVAEALGRVDVGQAVVVQQGLVLGVEAIEGTDALIARSGALAREGPRPVLVKCPKPGQDRHLDLPTLGPETVRQAVAAGLAGIAGAAGGCLLLDRREAVSLADEGGLFLQGFTGAVGPEEAPQILPGG